MIEVNNISKRYRAHQRLAPITFQVAAGEILGVVGPNGAGKSTLLSLIAGVTSPTGGEIRLRGQKIGPGAKGATGQIGYVPQEIALFPTLSVRENLLFFSRLAKLNSRQMSERTAELTEVFGLNQQLQTPVHHLSGGMKRKLNIAVALLSDPVLLILDEPTVGIDIKSRQEIVGFIGGQSQRGRTVVYTTHDSAEIERLCDRVLLLNEGEQRFLGTLVEAHSVAGLPPAAGGRRDLDAVFAALGGW